jgi:hypothetical protein
MDTTILLITPDLLAASRLAGLAAAAGARIEQRSAIMHDADLPACDLVLLDLQGQGGDLAPVVAGRGGSWPSGRTSPATGCGRQSRPAATRR